MGSTTSNEISMAAEFDSCNSLKSFFFLEFTVFLIRNTSSEIASQHFIEFILRILNKLDWGCCLMFWFSFRRLCEKLRLIPFHSSFRMWSMLATCIPSNIKYQKLCVCVCVHAKTVVCIFNVYLTWHESIPMFIWTWKSKYVKNRIMVRLR